MSPTRKTVDDYDGSTEEGRKAIGSIENRGADRLLGIIQGYQKASKHKVLVNIIPTRKGGIPRVWLSHPPEEITPLKAVKKNIGVPFFEDQVKIEKNDDDDEDATPPSSQKMRARDSAPSGSKDKQKKLKTVCGHCFTGDGEGDLHPNSAWIKCGEKNCRSVNFAYHSVCHGLRIEKGEEKIFCMKYIRCTSHIKTEYKIGPAALRALSSETDGEEDNSDQDFVSPPASKKSKGKERKRSKRAKVNQESKPEDDFIETNGNCNQVSQHPPSENDFPETDGNHVSQAEVNLTIPATSPRFYEYTEEVHATHNVDSIEQLDTLQLIETDDNFRIQFGKEDESKAVSVAQKISTGNAKIGIANGEKVVLNISPKPTPRLLCSKGDNTASDPNSFSQEPSS